MTGEISNFRMRPKHQYFSLKDENAVIDVVMFASDFSKVKFRPEEGMKVIVSGRVDVYEGSGKYQFYVETMEPEGIGALYQALKELQQKLSAEGLFSAPKKPINRFPKRIAVITSRSGAVIQDIRTTIRRRYPIAQVVLFPAVVQGTQAADTLVARLKEVNARGDFDTIIIGRGAVRLKIYGRLTKKKSRGRFLTARFRLFLRSDMKPIRRLPILWQTSELQHRPGCRTCNFSFKR